jgi:hypothetical protein
MGSSTGTAPEDSRGRVDLGFGAGSSTERHPADSHPSLDAPLPLGRCGCRASTATVIGLLQWTVLRRVSARAWVWVPVLVPASMVAAGVVSVGERMVVLVRPTVAVASCLLTGATLAWMLQSGGTSIPRRASGWAETVSHFGRTRTRERLNPKALETDAAFWGAWIGASALGGVLALPSAAIVSFVGAVAAWLTGGLWVSLPGPLAKPVVLLWLAICMGGTAGATWGAVVGFCQWLLLRRHSPWASRWVVASSAAFAVSTTVITLALVVSTTPDRSLMDRLIRENHGWIGAIGTTLLVAISGITQRRLLGAPLGAGVLALVGGLLSAGLSGAVSSLASANSSARVAGVAAALLGLSAGLQTVGVLRCPPQFATPGRAGGRNHHDRPPRLGSP